MKQVRHSVTDEWKAEVRRRIAALGISNAEFARRTGISYGALAQVLSPDAKGSTQVPLIEEHLGMRERGKDEQEPKVDEHW